MTQKTSCLIPFWILAVVFVACAGQQVNSITGLPLKPEDRASISAQELSNRYLGLYGLVTDELDHGEPDSVGWLKANLTKKMDETAKEVRQFNNGVILWKSTGRMPMKLVDQEVLVREKLDEVEALWVSRP